jgi:hypothetical protein
LAYLLSVPLILAMHVSVQDLPRHLRSP